MPNDTEELLLINISATQVQMWTETKPYAWWIWKLIPVVVEGVLRPPQSPPETLGCDSLPSYDGDTTRQSSTHTQHAESERDEFGTTVTEVTTTSTVVTTRKRYRVEDAQ